MEGPIAVSLLALLVLLDVLALRWGADSREGFRRDAVRSAARNETGGLPMTFDPFYAELRGRQRQEHLLAEAAHERLLLLARAGSRPRGRRLGCVGAALARPAMA